MSVQSLLNTRPTAPHSRTTLCSISIAASSSFASEQLSRSLRIIPSSNTSPCHLNTKEIVMAPMVKHRRSMSTWPAFFAIFVLVVTTPLLHRLHNHPLFSTDVIEDASAITLHLPSSIAKLNIQVGSNMSAMQPPDDDESVGMLLFEPNVGVANELREHLQKVQYPGRCFVVSAAVSGAPFARRSTSLATLHRYSANGRSSSLARAAPLENAPHTRNESNKNDTTAEGEEDAENEFGPGEGGVDIVPVVSLEAVLQAVPHSVSIALYVTDAQGFDLDIVRGASAAQLGRVGRIVLETILPGPKGLKNEAVRNDLWKDWVPYMEGVGFKLANPPKAATTGAFDAVWIRSDL